jgi:hypothetical protein
MASHKKVVTLPEASYLGGLERMTAQLEAEVAQVLSRLERERGARELAEEASQALARARQAARRAGRRANGIRGR